MFFSKKKWFSKSCLSGVHVAHPPIMIHLCWGTHKNMFTMYVGRRLRLLGRHSPALPTTYTHTHTQRAHARYTKRPDAPAILNPVWIFMGFARRGANKSQGWGDYMLHPHPGD